MDTTFVNWLHTLTTLGYDQGIKVEAIHKNTVDALFAKGLSPEQALEEYKAYVMATRDSVPEEHTTFSKGDLSAHFNFGKQGVQMQSYVIHAQGHPMNGQQVVRRITTPKVKGQWGTGTAEFFLSGGDDSTPVFTRLIEFLEHYGLPPLKPAEHKA